MSGRFVRASKFRHVAGAPIKDAGIIFPRQVALQGDGNNMAANGKYVAFASTGGGGPVVVCEHAGSTRMGASFPALNVHSATVTDMEFSPFVENVFATGSEDTKIGVTVLPDGGVTEDINDKSGRTTFFGARGGHQKKVLYVRFHPCTSSVLMSAGADNTVRIWDMADEGGNARYSFDTAEYILSAEWNSDGSLLGLMAKDKHMMLVDPRKQGAAQTADSFEGLKGAKLFFVDSLNMVGGVGFNSKSERFIRLWDARNLAKPLSEEADQGSGVGIPFFDPDTSMLYVAGKGEAQVKYYEITSEAPFVHGLNVFRDPTPTNAICFMPKRFCDVMKCEVARAFRMIKSGPGAAFSVVPTEFTVPRKSDQYQEDLYPDAYAGEATLTSDEYFSGVNRAPAKVSMRPGASDGQAARSAVAAAPLKSRQQLEDELAAANRTIEELRAEIDRLKKR